MSHFKQEDWIAYIQDKLLEDRREVMEDHLFSCDQCLDIYTELVEQYSFDLPDLVNEQDFTEILIKKLSTDSSAGSIGNRDIQYYQECSGRHNQSSQSDKGKIRSRRKIYQHPLFHYGVAAAVTFILMTSGFFQNVTGIVSTVEAASPVETEKPVSDSLMNKVLTLIELFEPIKKDGDLHE